MFSIFSSSYNIRLKVGQANQTLLIYDILKYLGSKCNVLIQMTNNYQYGFLTVKLWIQKISIFFLSYGIIFKYIHIQLSTNGCPNYQKKVPKYSCS